MAGGMSSVAAELGVIPPDISDIAIEEKELPGRTAVWLASFVGAEAGLALPEAGAGAEVAGGEDGDDCGGGVWLGF